MSRMRWFRAVLAVTCGVAALGFICSPASALGPAAPPRTNFAGVWVNTFSTTAFTSTVEGIPRLFANVDVEVPGGSVPLNVASVTVQIPTGATFTLPLDRVDLAAESSYFLDLTLDAGVVGFPLGTYTFTVRDTAGGITTATDDLTSNVPIPPATNLAVQGAVQVASSSGVAFLVNLASSPTPTIVWTAVPGTNNHELKIRSGFLDLNIFRKEVSAATTQLTLPGGVLGPGRRYRIRVTAEDGAFLPQSNTRSDRDIEIITQGPEIFLGTTGQTATEITLTARLYNTGPAVTVDVVFYIGRPDGLAAAARLEGIPVPQQLTGDLFNGNLLVLPLLPTDPPGHYVVGFRLVDPKTGDTVALATTTFTK